MTELKPRTFPLICVSCPKCNNVFAGSIFSAGLLIDDREFMEELEKYAEQGYTIDVRNNGEFELHACKCK